MENVGKFKDQMERHWSSKEKTIAHLLTLFALARHILIYPLRPMILQALVNLIPAKMLNQVKVHYIHLNHALVPKLIQDQVAATDFMMEL